MGKEYAFQDYFEKLIYEKYGFDLETALMYVKAIYKRFNLEMAESYESDAKYIYAVLCYPHLLERYAKAEEKPCITPEIYVELMLK